jgi:hypothetical protein
MLAGAESESAGELIWEVEPQGDRVRRLAPDLGDAQFVEDGGHVFSGT